jgi:5-methylthioadenosine/S-adenosylhomocysteine deaminase
VTADRSPTEAPGRQPVDIVITDTVVVTMNPDREILVDAAVAIAGDRIAAVGKTPDVLARCEPAQRIDGHRFVVTPGFVNCHIHATGEPLTRGYVPDDIGFVENVFSWLSPLSSCYTEVDERLSAQLASAEMLKSGTTAFIEAGTGWHIDAIADGLVEVGIRARVGMRVWDKRPEPHKFRQTTDQAIANLYRVLDDHASHAGGRVRGWAMLVGHTTCSDPLWRAAREAAVDRGVGLNFHMSPAPMDPEGFLEEFGERPIEHLATLGVLGPHAVLVHCVHVDDHEVELLGRHRCNVVHCPTTALKVAYGVTQIGRMPELIAAGANLCLGTDGNNASNYSDMMRATYLVAGLFKDARRDPALFPATTALELATLGGARAMLAEHEIGSIEAGKKADLVLHDRDRPEWVPLHDVPNQLVWSADGRGVHSVFVDGRRVVDDYRLVTIDEERLYRDAQAAGEEIVARSGLTRTRAWPTR